MMNLQNELQLEPVAQPGASNALAIYHLQRADLGCANEDSDNLVIKLLTEQSAIKGEGDTEQLTLQAWSLGTL